MSRSALENIGKAEPAWRACFDSATGWLSRLASRPPVSVVVPIFNGHDHVSCLLEGSLLWDEADEVLLVDDASSDDRIPALLRASEARQGKCRIITNSRNLGFVRSVNNGLREARAGNDVVVLNSDAQLSAGWIQALATCAYAFPDVATVSPLSNSAGFFSVPESNQPNTLPAGWSVQGCADALLLSCPLLLEPTLATCGFCWYVTARAIEQVGYLDQMMFHRGYAEETDFCLRAIDAGLRNLVALSQFVGHVGGQSFSSEKDELKTNNANILKAMQPRFMDRLREYEACSMVPDVGAAFSGLVAGGRDAIADFVRDGRLLHARIAPEGRTGTHVELRGSGAAAVATFMVQNWPEPSASDLDFLTLSILRYRPLRLDASGRESLPALLLEAAEVAGTRLTGHACEPEGETDAS